MALALPVLGCGRGSGIRAGGPSVYIIQPGQRAIRFLVTLSNRAAGPTVYLAQPQALGRSEQERSNSAFPSPSRFPTFDGAQIQPIYVLIEVFLGGPSCPNVCYTAVAQLEDTLGRIKTDNKIVDVG